MVSMGDEKCIRCLNCWKLYPNSKLILEHWVKGRCLFYCSICGKSFHENIKEIRHHFPAAHGIKYRIADRHRTNVHEMYQRIKRAKSLAAQNGSNRASGSQSEPTKQIYKQRELVHGVFKCVHCSSSFTNVFARNAHMKLHKTSQHLTSQRVSSPTTSVCSIGSTSSNEGRTLPMTVVMKSSALARPLGKVSSPQTQTKQTPERRASLSALTASTDSEEKWITDIQIKEEVIEEDEEESETMDTPTISQSPSPEQPDPPPAKSVKVENENSIESGGMPRLQVKKLTELQNPKAIVVPTSTSLIGTKIRIINPMTNVTTTMTPRQIKILPRIPPPQLHGPNVVQRAVTAPTVLQIQPQFKIASGQHVQGTRFFNPVFVVQSPPNTVQIPLQKQANTSQGTASTYQSF